MATPFKYPDKLSKMNADELKWEIDRLRAEIFEAHINDWQGFSRSQVKAVSKLSEIKIYLSTLAQDDLPSQP